MKESKEFERKALMNLILLLKKYGTLDNEVMRKKINVFKAPNYQKGHQDSPFKKNKMQKKTEDNKYVPSKRQKGMKKKLNRTTNIVDNSTLDPIKSNDNTI